MAQIIKRPFKTFNGSDWNTHYFQTSEDMIVDIVQSLGSTGYRKLPGGLTLQWGTLKTGSSPVVKQEGSTYYTELTPSVPIQFPRGYLCGFANVNYAGVWGSVSESAKYPKTGVNIIISRYNSNNLANIGFTYYVLSY
ncbi:hypothetical protein CF065_18915 [Clostridium sporogenes]|uniref:hypothetical protein n=1 Tax=Clostridium botulinum TaxID=1491 RepID=UPI003DA27BA5